MLNLLLSGVNIWKFHAAVSVAAFIAGGAEHHSSWIEVFISKNEKQITDLYNLMSNILKGKC